ncbi:MAG: hypothetical protein JXR03_10755 [Cyclobacteriaceae bacterium]
MKYLLIFSYIENQYKLIQSSPESPVLGDAEFLFEFEKSDFRIANKVLESLKLERELEEEKRECSEIAA